MKKFILHIADFFRQPLDESDLFLSAGISLLFYGCFQIYPPVAFIFLGITFIAMAYIAAPGKEVSNVVS